MNAEGRRPEWGLLTWLLRVTFIFSYPCQGSGKVLASGEAMLTDQKLPGYRFPLPVIGHAVWLFHRTELRSGALSEHSVSGW